MTESKTLSVVTCPESFAPLFAEAEGIFRAHFDQLERKPEEAQILVGGTRYLLMRCESFGLELHEELRKTFGDAGAAQIRYKIAKSIGMRDAQYYQDRLKVPPGATSLAMGPVHFAFTGWAYVDIFPEAAPAEDDSYVLAYAHPNSFECEAWLKNDIESSQTVCHMNAGYSAGWCQVSYGLELDAEEITCRSRGDKRCIFVMAPPSKLAGHVAEFREKYA